PLTFTATNGIGAPAVQLFTLTVQSPPVAGSQSLTTPEDTPLPITLSATDVDSPGLTFGVATGPSHGTLSAIEAPLCVPAAGRPPAPSRGAAAPATPPCPPRRPRTTPAPTAPPSRSTTPA